MARIQILELPPQPDVFITQFALILDQCAIGQAGIADFAESFANFANDCGARTSLVTAETLDIDQPASTTIGTVSVKVVPDLEGFREQIESAVDAAQTRLAEALDNGRG